jgi:hypothetical protein
MIILKQTEFTNKLLILAKNVGEKSGNFCFIKKYLAPACIIWLFLTKMKEIRFENCDVSMQKQK